ncbi:hypothetical protein [Streptomyces chryseus]
MAEQGKNRQGDVEISLTKEGARMSFNLDVEAVNRCLEEDGTLTIRFTECGATVLSALPNCMVTEN